MTSFKTTMLNPATRISQTLSEKTKQQVQRNRTLLKSIIKAVEIDPRKMATDSDACTAKIKRVLSLMVQNRRLSNNECDTIMGEFSDFLHDQVSLHRDNFVSSDPYSADDRLDVFSLETMDKAAYGHLWKVVAQVLLLSHGQASVERGFSVNKQMEVTNLQEDTFVAQRLVHDHITAVGGIMGVSLDKDLVRSCVASRARYQAYLDDTAKAKATDESTRKRRSVVDEIVGGRY